MSIPASELVSIRPRILEGSAEELDFNGLLLTTNEITPVNTLLKFSNAAAVADFFGYNTNEHNAALAYFNGYNNSMKKPANLYLYRHVNKQVAAFIRGRAAADPSDMLTELKELTNGAFSISLGGADITLEALDLSKVTSLSEAAEILQREIQAKGTELNNDVVKLATVTYSSLNKAFTVTAGISGAEVDVSAASGSVADVMGLSVIENVIVSAGAEPRSYTETLDHVLENTGNFVTYSTCEEITNEQDALDLATWANNNFSLGAQFLYVFYTTDITLNLNSSEDKALNSRVGTAVVGLATVVNALSGRAIIDAFNKKNFEGVTMVYGDVAYAAFVMGVASSIDWNGTNSTISFAFKAQAGLEANVTDIATAQNLDELKVNYMGNYATRNDQFILFQKGSMLGSFEWIDTYLNSTWLNNALQAQILSGFASVGRVPYNREGYTTIFAWCHSVISRALNNGVIDLNVKLSDLQKNELSKEAGLDISSALENNGYYFQILEADPLIRQQRKSPSCRLWYTYGGSVQKLELPVTTVA